MKVSQRDIVEVTYHVGNGRYKPHPAVVVSNEDVLLAEGSFMALMISHSTMNGEFSFELTPAMLTSPAQGATSYVKCQLVGIFYPDDVTGKFGSIRIGAFRELMKTFNRTVCSLDFT